MKKLMIALAVLSAVSVAHAAPSPSAYDRIQDGRLDGLSTYAWTAGQDISTLKTNLTKTDSKADSALSESSAALNLAGTARTEAQRANDRLDNMPTPKDGVDGKNGIDGLNGKDGKDGTNGIDGRNGVDGQNGADGKDGRDGTNGDTGATGAAGHDGADGKDGLNGKDAGMTAVNTNTAGGKSLQQRAADLDIRIAQQKADQVKTNGTVAAHTDQLADHEKRISSLESQTNARFGDLKNQIDDNKRNADAGIAGVAAMANIPQVTESQTFAVGAGVGTREGESAIAVGFSARASQNVVVKASVAGDTQQSWAVGAGVSYGW